MTDIHEPSVRVGEGNLEADALLDLSSEMIWAFVERQISEVKQVAARFKDGDFKTGLETALEEIETRLNKTEYEAMLDRILHPTSSGDKP